MQKIVGVLGFSSAVAVVGCAPSIEEVEDAIKKQVDGGSGVKSVSCPKDQAVDDGVEFKCQVTMNSGSKGEVTVSREGDTVSITGKVKDKVSKKEDESD